MIVLMYKERTTHVTSPLQFGLSVKRFQVGFSSHHGHPERLLVKSKSLTSPLSRLLSLFLLLPISPFLPLIFYLSADPDSQCSHYLQSLLHFKVGLITEQEDQSRTTELYQQTDPNKRWIQYNLRFFAYYFLSDFVSMKLPEIAFNLKFGVQTTA